MTRLLLAAAAAAGAMTLAGCNFLNTPSNTMMKQCLAVETRAPLDMPLSTYVDWAKAHGQELHWEHVDGGTFVVRFRPKDAPPEADSEIGLELRNNDQPSNQPSCGPGSAVITRVSVNGEVADSASMRVITDRLIEMLREQVQRTVGDSVPSPSPSAQSVPSVNTAENGADEDMADERRYYAEQAGKALKQPIRITLDTVTYYCCLTVQSIVDDFRKNGALPKVTKADDGTVYIDVTDPKGRWKGWTDLEFKFDLLYDENDILTLSEVKNAGKLVAASWGPHFRTDQLLIDRFPMKATQEPVP